MHLTKKNMYVTFGAICCVRTKAGVGNLRTAGWIRPAAPLPHYSTGNRLLVGLLYFMNLSLFQLLVLYT